MEPRTKTTTVVFHHSLADKSTAAMIRSWHLARGWEDIGYHFVVLKDGTIEHGRDLNLIGSHAYGKNRYSIGVCLEGDFRKDEPTRFQLIACEKIYHESCRAYQKKLIIDFHRPAILPNACPGKKLDRKYFKELVYKAF